MIRVKKIKYISDYKLKLLFSDEKMKVVDFEDWINEGGVYLTPLKASEYFKKVKMDEFNYSICWPNGADFSPDVLYNKGVDVEQKKCPTPKRQPATPKRSTSRKRTASTS